MMNALAPVNSRLSHDRTDPEAFRSEKEREREKSAFSRPHELHCLHIDLNAMKMQLHHRRFLIEIARKHSKLFSIQLCFVNGQWNFPIKMALWWESAA